MIAFNPYHSVQFLYPETVVLESQTIPMLIYRQYQMTSVNPYHSSHFFLYPESVVLESSVKPNQNLQINYLNLVLNQLTPILTNK